VSAYHLELILGFDPTEVQQTEVLLEAATNRSKELDDQVKQLRVANESSSQSQEQTISLLVSGMIKFLHFATSKLNYSMVDDE
jgi:hypothetical protein